MSLLRSLDRMNALSKQSRANDEGASLGRWDSKISLFPLENKEHQLQVLNRDLKEFAEAVADLQTKITERQVQAQSLMKDFDALWW